jgi:hypothetical protein
MSVIIGVGYMIYGLIFLLLIIIILPLSLFYLGSILLYWFLMWRYREELKNLNYRIWKLPNFRKILFFSMKDEENLPQPIKEIKKTMYLLTGLLFWLIFLGWLVLFILYYLLNY